MQNEMGKCGSNVYVIGVGFRGARVCCRFSSFRMVVNGKLLYM